VLAGRIARSTRGSGIDGGVLVRHVPPAGAPPAPTSAFGVGAVRAAASLTLELAREGGCALLLPGERRPTPIERDLASWPAAHVRLALVAGGPGSPAPMLGAQTRMGPVIHVAALPLERLPPAVLGIARGARVLVVPGPPDAEQRAGARAPGSNRPLRPSFEVAGCRGYVLRSRPGERAA